MDARVEISYYPLKDDFIEQIQKFIDRLNEAGSDLEINTNEMSTQIKGNYDTIMDLLTGKMKQELQSERCCFVIKVIPGAE